MKYILQTKLSWEINWLDEQEGMFGDGDKVVGTLKELKKRIAKLVKTETDSREWRIVNGKGKVVELVKER